MKETKTINIPKEGTYKGEIENDKRHGKGEMYFDNGNIYSGEWKDDEFHGNGIYKNQTDSYEGIWSRGQLMKGKMIFCSGERYEGNCWCGVPHGIGTYYFRNGDKYAGNWYNYAKEGYGTFTWSNGDYYEGEWLDNEFHGKGLLVKKGIQKKGNWQKGKFIKV